MHRYVRYYEERTINHKKHLVFLRKEKNNCCFLAAFTFFKSFRSFSLQKLHTMAHMPTTSFTQDNTILSSSLKQTTGDCRHYPNRAGMYRICKPLSTFQPLQTSFECITKPVIMVFRPVCSLTGMNVGPCNDFVTVACRLLNRWRMSSQSSMDAALQETVV